MTRIVLCALGLCALAQGRALQSGRLEEKVHAQGDGLCDPDVQQYSGYYKLKTGVLPKNYFYWFFEARENPETAPLVLWMTGGPGCSSEVALFGENGPCAVTADGNATTLNPFSWNTNANLLYIDQPAGTGFSYGTGLDHDEAGVAKDMYDFLQQFLKEHSQYQTNDFYTFGESYAGHYVPAVTHEVWANNNDLPIGAILINLKGTGVGNGLTDPQEQYKWYPEMAASTNDHSPVVNKTGYDLMVAATIPCTLAIKNCQTNATACLTATEVCNLGLLEPYQLTGRNVYDMRIPCEVPPLCYDFSNVGIYLARPDVQATLGVAGHKWSDCNHAVAIAFELSGDWMKNYHTMIPDLLESDISVLIYAGDQDYICNWLGNQAWTKALDWEYSLEFNAATPTNVTFGNSTTPAGQLTSAYGFNFFRVFDAGHMVPRDQPEAALNMLNAFTSGKL
jgi:cathepsin A (carboxypeptidase C)